MAGIARLSTPATAAEVERALRGQTRPWGEYVFQGLLFTALLVALGFLLWLLGDIFVRSLPVWTDRGVGSFVGSNLSSDPLRAGIAQGLFGSVLLMVIVVVACHLKRYAARQQPDPNLTPAVVEAHEGDHLSVRRNCRRFLHPDKIREALELDVAGARGLTERSVSDISDARHCVVDLEACIGNVMETPAGILLETSTQ